MPYLVTSDKIKEKGGGGRKKGDGVGYIISSKKCDISSSSQSTRGHISLMKGGLSFLGVIRNLLCSPGV